MRGARWLALVFRRILGAQLAGWAVYAMHKFALVAERAAQMCATLAAFAFLVSGVVYLYLGRWTVTHQDYWWIYDFYLNHSLIESALLTYAHHSLFFPSFLSQVDLRFFHGNQLPLFLVGLALLLITVGLLLVPVWRDKTVGLTAKILATLVVIVGNFWMARAFITASGVYNCENSLVMAGAALGFLLLQIIGRRLAPVLPVAAIVVLAGFIASFSQSTGLAIWPTLLLLAWGLRLPKYFLGMMAAAGLTAVIIFVLLPGHDWLSPPDPLKGLPSVSYVTVIWLCRLLGAPIFVAIFSWWPDKFYRPMVESSELALCTAVGGVGLALATLAVLPQIIRRNVNKSSLEWTGLALIVFTLFVTSLIVTGRAGVFHARPFEVVASRFFFWSTLFWTGLLLVAIARAQSKQWLRWPVYLVALAVPILVFPAHYKNAVWWRNIRWNAESAAASLVNGVRDDQLIPDAAFLAAGSGREQLYRTARQFRARRLDMFADGLQDWIGLSEANLFGGRHEPEGLKGQCRVAALVQCDNGAPAARVFGQASKHGQSIPKTLVIVDPTGVVRGVARSSAPVCPFINRTFYLGKLPAKITANWFVGYIRDYDPQLDYAVRSADNGALSEEKIPVKLPVTKPAKP